MTVRGNDGLEQHPRKVEQARSIPDGHVHRDHNFEDEETTSTRPATPAPESPRTSGTGTCLTASRNPTSFQAAASLSKYAREPGVRPRRVRRCRSMASRSLRWATSPARSASASREAGTPPATASSSQRLRKPRILAPNRVPEAGDRAGAGRFAGRRRSVGGVRFSGMRRTGDIVLILSGSRARRRGRKTSAEDAPWRWTGTVFAAFGRVAGPHREDGGGGAHGLERRPPVGTRGAPRRARRDPTRQRWFPPRRRAQGRRWRPLPGTPTSGRHAARRAATAYRSSGKVVLPDAVAPFPRREIRRRPPPAGGADRRSAFQAVSAVLVGRGGTPGYPKTCSSNSWL